MVGKRPTWKLTHCTLYLKFCSPTLPQVGSPKPSHIPITSPMLHQNAIKCDPYDLGHGWDSNIKLNFSTTARKTSCNSSTNGRYYLCGKQDHLIEQLRLLYATNIFGPTLSRFLNWTLKLSCTQHDIWSSKSRDLYLCWFLKEIVQKSIRGLNHTLLVDHV